MYLKKNEFQKIEQILNAGGVIIFPTDTLYGLGCDALNPQAILKVYRIKDRPFGKPFPILVKDLEMLLKYAVVNEEKIKKIKSAKKPTTFILKSRRNLSPLVLSGRTGAFRIPKDRWLKQLLKNINRPLVATSANLHKQKPLSDPKKYKEVFGEKAKLIDGVVLGGINRKRKGSMIIDLTVKPYKVLRK